MRKRRMLAFWCAAVLVLQACAAQIPDSLIAKVKNACAKSKHPLAGVGLVVQDVAADTPLVALNADSQLNPASLTKLVTAAVALEMLGPTFTFKTTLYTDGFFDRNTGCINGNLYIRGSGDPGFLAERLWLLTQHLLHAGIKSIKGNLVLDDFQFDSASAGPGFSEDRSSRAYDAPVGALSASFNTVAVVVRPGSAVDSVVRATMFPKMKGLSIVCSARTVDAPAKSTIDARTENRAGKTSIVITGSMGIRDNPRYIYRKVWQTWENFGNAMTTLFADNGIELKGSIRHGPTPDSLRGRDTLLTFESQPLLDFVRPMFKYSSNFAAEMVFKALAAQRDSQPASWPAASRIVGQWWKSQGLPGTPVIKNGSGMGNSNRLSASQIVAVLRHVWNRKDYSPDYISALSISAIDGTIKSRFKGSPLAGIIRGKTGTLNDYGVSCIAGYVLMAQKTYAFAIMMNVPNAGQFEHWRLQEKLLEISLPGNERTPARQGDSLRMQKPGDLPIRQESEDTPEEMDVNP
jgi:D-alanyl-D-alanine carboxypeptidase/D-alanyl-D-alanine-endopeptidase (penicillin-binding protein 4)